MEIHAVHVHATAVFLLQPMHDGFHSPAIYSGPGEEFDEDQILLLRNDINDLSAFGNVRLR